MEKQLRGQLTNRIKEKSKEILGYEISRTELRLMAYVQYVMVNEQKINPNMCNRDDRKILQKWRKKNFIDGGILELSITKEFWDAMCEILFLGYVDLSE